MSILKYTDKLLLIISIILFAFGLIMVFSASNITAFMRYYASPYRFLIKQTLFLLGGIILALVIVKTNTKIYGFLSWPALVVILCALGFVLIYGKTTNSATSWFPIGPFSFQPSEFAKVIMIIWMASFYEVKRKNLNTYTTSLFPILICLVAVCLMMAQPDLGTAIIFGVISIFIFMIAPIDTGIKLKTAGIVGGIVLIGCLFLISSGKSLILERQLTRLDFSNPCSEEKFYTSGNQICNAYIAVNNGGLLGKGLGNSTQKYLYLPEAHTDFIFAIVLEEGGLIVGVGILTLYFILLVRIVNIGKKAINNMGAIMCYGVAVYIFLHIIINLMGIFGMMPMTGVPLPFISYGGSFTICLIVALTIVQRVNIDSKLAANRGKNKVKR